MNAMPSDVSDRAQREDRLERRLDGRERSWLECQLQTWGDWHEQHADFQGFPRASSIQLFLDGFGGGRPGHRILAEERPDAVIWVDLRMPRLPEHEQLAVWAHYVPWVKENGQVWTPEAKARLLGISWDAYRKRLTRARFRILGYAVTL